MVTIRDVAKKAGVSTTTVSRYLNKTGYVGQTSRENIEKAIKELDYIPNEAARVLNMKTSKIIGLIVPDISNPYFSVLAKGVEEYCSQQGYIMILGNSDGNVKRTNMYLRYFKQQNVSGVLIVNDGVVKMPKGIPYISIDRRQDNDKYSVITNHFLGGQIAAREVLKTKPNNVLIMKGPLKIDNAVKRYRGMRDVFDQNPSVNVTDFIVDSYQSEKAASTARKIGEQLKNFDTVMASNDVFAFEIMKEARRLGLIIPTDLQIIGYDGIDFVEYSSPRLSSIKQPAYEIGYQATDTVIQLIEKKETEEIINIQLDPVFLDNDTLRK